MKVNAILAPWKGDKRYTQMAARAAALKKRGSRAEEIEAVLREEYGPPAVRESVRDSGQPLHIFGEVGSDIDPVAVSQIQMALRLPIAVQGALMPDAHVGQALPIGGVFAAHQAVSPSMVGVDIGCRMHLTVYASPPEVFQKSRAALFADLQAVTTFGIGATSALRPDHEILEDSRWQLTSQTRGLQAKAARQLGTSGSGNHFAELVIGERLAEETALPERFCGLLTHSGSRGIGYSLATHYMRLAAQETAQTARIPKRFEWLSMEREAGQEYWQAMELAGDYAQACHEIIHATFARRARLTPFATIQNHHNFAWRKGNLVIHRKGATPAGAGLLGVIPGSMGSASYIVEGRGHADALNSASHGAGRRGSRTDARDRISLSHVRQWLALQDILVEGLSADEAPQAYKDIEQVMGIQIAAGLVTPLARMKPIAVIMAGDSGEN